MTVYLHVVNGVPVRMSGLPAAWGALMRKTVEERLEQLRQGTGIFEEIGGKRLSARAEAIEETLFEERVLKSLIGEAAQIRARVSATLFTAGVGGVDALASLVDRIAPPGPPASFRWTTLTLLTSRI